MKYSWLIQSASVAAGGAVGAVARYWVSGWVQRYSAGQFPLGTLFVNVSGSFLLGFLSLFLFEHMQLPPWVRLAVGAGLLVAFTTFSTFSLETLELVENGALFKAGLNVLLNVVVCLLAVAGGVSLARWLS